MGGCVDYATWNPFLKPGVNLVLVVLQAEKRRTRAKQGEQESCKLSTPLLSVCRAARAAPDTRTSHPPVPAAEGDAAPAAEGDAAPAAGGGGGGKRR